MCVRDAENPAYAAELRCLIRQLEDLTTGYGWVRILQRYAGGPILLPIWWFRPPLEKPGFRPHAVEAQAMGRP